MTFDDFWEHLSKLPANRRECPSQGRGGNVRFRIDGDLLLKWPADYEDEGGMHKTTRDKAKEYFEYLAGGVKRFGKGGFRRQRSSYFHEIYAYFTGDTRRCDEGPSIPSRR